MSAWIKIHQILVIFEATDQFLFKFCINRQCHETQLLCTFLAETKLKRSLSRSTFGEIESLKFGILMGSLHQNDIKFQLKKYRGIIFHDTEQWCKVWVNPDLVVSKMTWGIEWTFIRALKSLKNYTMMGSFCSKHVFQLENFRGIMYHNTERWCKI